MPIFISQIITKRYAKFIGAALLIGFLAVPFGAWPAVAATVTPRVELSGDPGAVVTDTLKLQNEEKQSKTYFIVFENFESQDETGNPHFTQRREDLSSWLEAPATVTVGPGSAVEVPFKVRIPSSAEPGGHFAAIFFQTEPPNPDKPGQVALSAKLGSLIFLTVAGDFQQGATILEFAAKNKQQVFNSLPVAFYYRFQNTGKDHLKPLGDVFISNTIGRTAKILPANPVDGSVLPKSIRRFETVWANGGKPLQQEPNPQLPEAPKGFWNSVAYQWQNFAFGKYTATLKVVFGTKELQSANAKYTFYIIPWQLSLVAVVGALIILIGGRFGLRRYNRYIIAKASRGSPSRRR